jgi:hypothetical protein
MGGLNNYFFPYSKRKKVVISLVLAHKGTFKNIVFQSALIKYFFSFYVVPKTTERGPKSTEQNAEYFSKIFQGVRTILPGLADSHMESVHPLP